MISDRQPELSVVIPTLGRTTLLMTVQSLAEAAWADRLEVIVAGAIVETTLASALQALAGRFAAFRILPVAFADGDSSRKKNAGLTESRCELVAFLDDDVRVAPDWPQLVQACFQRPEVGMVSGPSLIPRNLPVMARLAGVALASPAAGYVAERYTKGAGGPRAIKWSRIIGCNMAFRKSGLNRAGGFQPRFWPGEEMVAAFRVAQQGAVIMFQPEAWVEHYPRATLFGFVRQIYGYGATRIRLIRAGLDIEPATIIPALWVAAFILLGILGWWCRWCALAWGISLVVYGLAVLATTVWIVSRTKRAVDMFLLAIIPLMHFTYGLAEWVELICPNRDLSESHSVGKCRPEPPPQP